MYHYEEVAMVKMSAAKIVREVMKIHGHFAVYNNIYKTGTRTVKCYCRRDSATTANLVNSIKNVLNSLGIRYEIKFNSGQYTPSSLIVKFPG